MTQKFDQEAGTTSQSQKPTKWCILLSKGSFVLGSEVSSKISKRKSMNELLFLAEKYQNKLILQNRVIVEMYMEALYI